MWAHTGNACAVIIVSYEDLGLEELAHQPSRWILTRVCMCAFVCGHVLAYQGKRSRRSGSAVVIADAAQQEDAPPTNRHPRECREWQQIDASPIDTMRPQPS